MSYTHRNGVQHMFRIATMIRLWAVAALTLASPASYSYGLGELDLRSHLDEPLLAVVELVGQPGTEDLSANLLPPEYYESRNLMYTPVLQSAQVAVRRDAGSVWLEVTTANPVNEFLVDLAISVTAGRLTQIRHYTLLVDVEVQGTAAVAQPGQAANEAEAVQPNQRAPTAPTFAIERTGTGIEKTGTGIQASEQTYGPVRSGESLWKISEKLDRQAGTNLYTLMDQLVELNPNAFVNGDPNRLRVGSTLALPASASLQANGISPASAVKATEALARLEASWNPTVNEPVAPQVPTEPLPNSTPETGDQLEIASAPEQDLTHVLEEWIQSENDARSPQDIQGIERDLSLAAAEQETLNQENVRLQTQIEALEERVTDLQRLLTLQEAVIEQRAAAGQEENAAGLTVNQVSPVSEPRSRTSVAFWVACILGLIAAAALGYVAYLTFYTRRNYEYGPTLDIQFGDASDSQQQPVEEVPELNVEPQTIDKENWSEVLEAAAIAADESLEEETNPAFVLPETQAEPVPAESDFELSQPASAEAATTDSQEIEALLDQAKRLITDGDVEQAEDVLEKVLRRGSQAQRAEATYLFLEMS